MKIETKKLKTNKVQNDKNKENKERFFKNFVLIKYLGAWSVRTVFDMTSILSETLDFPFAIGYHLQIDS